MSRVFNCHHTWQRGFCVHCDVSRRAWQNMNKKKAKAVKPKPKPVTRYTGGGIASACHACGCCHHECECQDESQRSQ